MRPFQARELAFGLGLAPAQLTQAVAAILGAYRAFRDLDATMVEMNPLVVTKDGQVLALDVKMSFDDNAMFRRPNVAELRDYAQEDPREAEAAEHGLNYVALDGDIGCIINGAGLAMATMDMIKHAGGEPANFLDIGGGSEPRPRRRRLSTGPRRPQGERDPRERVRRHQPLRLGGGGRGAGRAGDRGPGAPRRAARRHERPGRPPYPRGERPPHHHRRRPGRRGGPGRRGPQQGARRAGDDEALRS